MAWLKIYKNAVFVAPKTYASLSYDNEEDIKLKGVSSKSAKFEDIEKSFYGGKSIKFEDQLSFNKSNLVLLQNYSSKTISMGGYDKRIFSKDLKNTLPLKDPDI